MPVSTTIAQGDIGRADPCERGGNSAQPSAQAHGPPGALYPQVHSAALAACRRYYVDISSSHFVPRVQTLVPSYRHEPPVSAERPVVLTETDDVLAVEKPPSYPVRTTILAMLPSFS
jgi:hypothetical protein